MTDDKNHRAARPAHSARHARSARRPSPSPTVGAEKGISTIRSGQGARVTTRENAAEAAGRARKNAEKRYYERHPEAKSSGAGPARSGRNVVLLVIMAILVLAIVFVLGSCVTAALSGRPSGGEDRPTQTLKLTEQEQQIQDQQQQHDAGTEQVEPGGSVSFSGETFTLSQQDDGTWALVASSSSGASSTLFLLEGQPVALMRSYDTILIPENRDGGWDVVCYVVGGHSAASYVTTEDGGIAGGEGEATAASFGDGTIVVTDATGATHDVSFI